ncbi:hypothetical protein C0991_006150 [Blastosporella zonata]|nr:hypothetical protein C0991_006150 [Blastosporella zonata]
MTKKSAVDYGGIDPAVIAGDLSPAWAPLSAAYMSDHPDEMENLMQSTGLEDKNGVGL